MGLGVCSAADVTSDLFSFPGRAVEKAPKPLKLFGCGPKIDRSTHSTPWKDRDPSLILQMEKATGWALCLSATLGRAIGGLCNVPSFLVRLPGEVELRAIFSSRQGCEFVSLPRWGCKTGLCAWFTGCGPKAGKTAHEALWQNGASSLVL